MQAMLAEMDANDWREWTQFAELEPFGAIQEGLYFGLLASLQYNANRGKNAKTLEPKDFFPHLQRLAEPRVSPRKVWAVMLLDAWKQGAKISRRKGSAASPEPPPAP